MSATGSVTQSAHLSPCDEKECVFKSNPFQKLVSLSNEGKASSKDFLRLGGLDEQKKFLTGIDPIQLGAGHKDSIKIKGYDAMQMVRGQNNQGLQKSDFSCFKKHLETATNLMADNTNDLDKKIASLGMKNLVSEFISLEGLASDLRSISQN